jgi:hypothetical protein
MHGHFLIKQWSYKPRHRSWQYAAVAVLGSGILDHLVMSACTDAVLQGTALHMLPM